MDDGSESYDERIVDRVRSRVRLRMREKKRKKKKKKKERAERCIVDARPTVVRKSNYESKLSALADD